MLYPAMMRIWSLMFIIALVTAKHEQFNGWKSYYIEVGRTSDIDMLRSLEDKYELSIIGPPTFDHEGIVLVKPDVQEQFLNTLDEQGISHRLHVDDIKSQLEFEDKILETHRLNMSRKKHGQIFPYDSYQELEVVENYLDYIGNTYPNITTVVEGGKSFEGRPIKYLKISNTGFEDLNKPVIFIDAGTHAREWISIPVATWAIRKLVEDVTEKDLLDKFDWIILPVVNPDGYKFTHENNRFWRKTRSTDQHHLSKECPGVDANRNFNIMWNTSGTSVNPCTNVFCGSTPFSESEARVVRDILTNNLSRLVLYINLHSFGSKILYSWTYDGSLSQHDSDLYSVGKAMASAIDQHSLPKFPRYTVGIGPSLLRYYASGTSADYAHSLGIVLSFTYELPGPKTGFILDPAYIEQVCRESWEGIIVGARLARDLYGKKKLTKT